MLSFGNYGKDLYPLSPQFLFSYVKIYTLFSEYSPVSEIRGAFKF